MWWCAPSVRRQHHRRAGNPNRVWFDGAANLVSKIEAKATPVLRETLYASDSSGNLRTVTRLADDRTAQARTVMEYDELGNMTALTDAEGHVTRFSDHDIMENPFTITDPGGKVWTHAPDAAGRLTLAADPLGHARSFEYDAVGNKTREVDAEGREKTYHYDGTNDAVRVTDTGGNATFSNTTR